MCFNKIVSLSREPHTTPLVSADGPMVMAAQPPATTTTNPPF